MLLAFARGIRCRAIETTWSSQTSLETRTRNGCRPIGSASRCRPPLKPPPRHQAPIGKGEAVFIAQHDIISNLRLTVPSFARSLKQGTYANLT